MRTARSSTINGGLHDRDPWTETSGIETTRQRPTWAESPRQKPPWEISRRQRPHWTENPLDRDPRWIETPPRQRPPCSEPSWTENPGQTPPGQNPPPRGETNASENITFPQLRLWVVIKCPTLVISHQWWVAKVNPPHMYANIRTLQHIMKWTIHSMLTFQIAIDILVSTFLSNLTKNM